MDIYESEIRLRVLNDSLELEGYATFWLRVFLDIESTKSKTLGNSSSAISLNNKVNLLIDLGALSNDGKDHFLKFMEIRNQFMHNPKAKTFSDCYSFINGIENWFSKRYAEDKTIKKEEQFSKWYDDLSKYVISEASMIFNKVAELLEERRTYEKNKMTIELLKVEVPQLLDAIFENNPSPQLLNKTNEFLKKYIDDFKFLPQRKIYDK